MYIVPQMAHGVARIRANCSGKIKSTALTARPQRKGGVFGVWRAALACGTALPAASSSSLLSSLESGDTQVYEPYIRALLGTAAHSALPTRRSNAPAPLCLPPLGPA